MFKLSTKAKKKLKCAKKVTYKANPHIDITESALKTNIQFGNDILVDNGCTMVTRVIWSLEELLNGTP